MMETPSDLKAQKKALRRDMLLLRAEAARANPEAAQKLRDLFLANVPLPDGCVVASYCARECEIDPMPLAEALRARGHDLCLPAVTEKGASLVFRSWRPGTPLVPGLWDIPEPPPTAPEAEPAVLLVPLLAFDRLGNRLGYGGGYYDRALMLLRAKRQILAIGLGFYAQKSDLVPVGLNDAQLDIVATETGIFRF
jgi:5-formyltetrahydrofolate cyclo-ligase